MLLLSCSVNPVYSPAVQSCIETKNKLASAPDSAQSAIELCSSVLATSSLSSAEKGAVYESRSMAYSIQGNARASLSDAEAAIKYRPNWGAGYFRRAFAHYKLGNYEASLADYDLIIGSNPPEWASFNNRAAVHCRLRNRAEWKEDMVAARQVNSNYTLIEKTHLIILGFYTGSINNIRDEELEISANKYYDSGCPD